MLSRLCVLSLFVIGCGPDLCLEKVEVINKDKLVNSVNCGAYGKQSITTHDDYVVVTCSCPPQSAEDK